MAEMPEVIYAGIADHAVHEPHDWQEDVCPAGYEEFHRRDTCTPNEKLEELLNDWKVRYKFKPEADKTLADCIRELREVMK